MRLTMTNMKSNAGRLTRKWKNVSSRVNKEAKKKTDSKIVLRSNAKCEPTKKVKTENRQKPTKTDKTDKPKTWNQNEPIGVTAERLG